MKSSQHELLSAYKCPNDKSKLSVTPQGLKGTGRVYSYIPDLNLAVPDFRDISSLGSGSLSSLQMYDFEGARLIYRNFLAWLFKTFSVEEVAFRRDLVRRLCVNGDARVLVTGCGLGEDVLAIHTMLNDEGTVFALDLAPEMVVGTYRTLDETKKGWERSISLSIADACKLPFADEFFDATFHFGGINLFDDIQLAISEMARVTKSGGRVTFGDEGVAPWLRNTDYGRMVVANNHLWAAEAPLRFLPASAVNPVLSWVLGNCFYVIEFEKQSSGPFIDPDVPHIGRRGGTMRTRYYGQLEGVDPELRQRVLAVAAAKSISVTDWLQRAIGDALAKDSPL